MNLNDLSHHAYLLIGSDSTRTELISILEKKHKIPQRANPDFFDRQYDNFTIDDAREVKAFHGTRPIGESGLPAQAGKKIFILMMSGITSEAQNALLKLLEEPAEYAHFFIIVPSAHLLLPTVKSRLLIIESDMKDEEPDKELKKEAEEFLAMSPAKRLEEIKSLMDAIGKEKKKKQDAIEFLNAVEQAIYRTKGVKEGKKALESVATIRQYVNDRAPSLKMLLEYAALNI